MAVQDVAEVAHSLSEPEKTDPHSLKDTSGDQTAREKQVGRRLSLAGGGSLSLADVESVHVRIRNLSVSINLTPSLLEPATYQLLFTSKPNSQHVASLARTLLDSVAADLEPGSLTAIIGGSGSGKTTLLNTMAERVTSSRLCQTGTTTFNGRLGVHSVRHAYVMQQDVLLPTLTVRETLRYSADLRLPASTPACHCQRVVDEVIRELGLKDCADTRIGSSQHRGCSGGEKRRVSIGVQLLANPSVLFLDEPTTGLDATSAFQVMRALKALARKGRTIITTIHQPRSEIWHLFDNLIVLSKGGPVYSGTMVGCLPWFNDQGLEMPAFVNPADHVIDISAVDNRTPELEQESRARVERLRAAWRLECPTRFAPVTAAEDTVGRGTRGSTTVARNGFGRQLCVLTDRTFKVTYRDPLGMAASVFEAIFMGLVVGYLFYNLGRDQAGIRSREGGLYTVAGLQGYLILIFEVYRMTIDIATFDREFSDNCVDALPFIFSRRLARLPTEDVPVPLLFTLLVYFMAGFDRDAEKLLIFFAITLVSHYIAVTCAMTCVVAVRHFAGASLIANLVYTLQSVAAGIFIQSNTIPVYVRWLKWITYTFYAFSAYAGNEFQGSFYDCPSPGGPSNPACIQYTGEYIMESLGFPRDWVARPIIAMVAFTVLFCALSSVGLHFFKPGIAITRTRTTDTDLSAGKETMAAPSAEVRTVDLGLDRFALALDKTSIFGKKLPRKTILNPVDTTFQAGVLNIIMGPSGSGKTSLLNAMALRLRNSVGTKYRPSGRLTFNDAMPSNAVIRSVCSYVCQDDDALLPSLTVRETLRFAAGLRLPYFMSAAEKSRRADEILLKMGLKDCANTLIGSDIIKGISGGEKRRVSIAVQILTDPRVLLLDEPTSGLDAFTASSIMEVLRGLSSEGRTLILTIHQARSDLFRHFGNILLLARGGSSVFAGPAKDMLDHFGTYGYACPRDTNPADFALDLITVDLQRDDREAESQERVQKLIEGWKSHGQRPLDGAGPLKAELQEEGTMANTEAPMANEEFQARARTCPRGNSFNKADLSTPAELGALVRKRTAFSAALPLLLHRAFINTRRQPQQILARTMQVLGLAIVLTLFFAPLRNDYYSVQNRMGFVQELGALYFVGMLQNVAIYPAERDVFYREDDDGVYGVDPFLAAYTILEVPFEVVSCLLSGVLAVFAVGLPRTLAILGIMFNTLFGHTGFAVNAMGIFLSVATVMAGILSIDMPDMFRAANYLSPIRYATRAVAPYSLRGVTFTCTDAQRLPTGGCPIETGQQVLELYKFDVDPVVNVGALAGSIVAYRILAHGKDQDTMKDQSTVIEEFNDLVNMTVSELETWLKSDDSQSAGWPKGEGATESVGHDSGRNIISILESNPDKDPERYTDDQIQHMRKVVAYCKRHLAQEEKVNNEKSTEEVKRTKSYASLKNWGHDILKSNKGNKEAKNGDSEQQTSDKRKADDKNTGANKKRETEKGRSSEENKAGTAKKSRDEKNEAENADEDKEDDGEELEQEEEEETEGEGEDEEEDEGKEEESKGAENPAKGPKPGDTVSWNWGNGQPEGKVLDVKGERTTVETKRGNEVSRKGDPEDPAIVIDTGKSKAIKSAHELN
ncbi:ABC transporter [Hirsutella rhossiliensis]|uniref:ABC transporter domain-containing protein n=1 Tax=Hirsutella rhossiliensis TaxID=111463 RepID=A0A9P8SED9_9HYPO|nr:ABC transporter domain-containing protein [Hirsutella rhossiliensis]KAH0958295.1 ABC transporter domain-containing protein [Hirsutella rhossiliensis]